MCDLNALYNIEVLFGGKTHVTLIQSCIKPRSINNNLDENTKKVKILKIFQCTFVLRVLKPNHLVRVLFITMQAFVSPMVTSTFDHG